MADEYKFVISPYPGVATHRGAIMKGEFPCGAISYEISGKRLHITSIWSHVGPTKEFLSEYGRTVGEELIWLCAKKYGIDRISWGYTHPKGKDFLKRMERKGAFKKTPLLNRGRIIKMEEPVIKTVTEESRAAGSPRRGRRRRLIAQRARRAPRRNSNNRRI